MSIYLVKRTDHVRYEEFAAVVVIATTEDQARELAKKLDGDQAASVWDAATVSEVNPDGEPGIVLSDFNAG